MQLTKRFTSNLSVLMVAMTAMLASAGASAQAADPGAVITSGLSGAATTVGAVLLTFAGVWVLYVLYSLITKRKSS